MGHVVPLFCEDDLAKGKKTELPKAKLSPLLVADAVVARKTATTFLEHEMELTGDMIVKGLNKKRHTLVGMDKAFGLEIAFFASMVGDPGRTRLEEEMLMCLPSKEVDIAPTVASQMLGTLGDGKLLSFVSESVKPVFTAVKEIVTQIAGGHRPKLTTLGQTAFMTKVCERLSLFVRHFAEDEKGGVKLFTGTEALQLKFAALTAKIEKKEEYTLEDLAVYQIYSWLATNDITVQVGKWTKELLEKEEKKDEEEAAKEESEGKPKPPSKAVIPQLKGKGGKRDKKEQKASSSSAGYFT